MPGLSILAILTLELLPPHCRNMRCLTGKMLLHPLQQQDPISIIIAANVIKPESLSRLLQHEGLITVKDNLIHIKDISTLG